LNIETIIFQQLLTNWEMWC